MTTTLLTFIILGICLTGMAIGLIIQNKVLRKGCSDNPDGCTCRKQGKNPSECTDK